MLSGNALRNTQTDREQAVKNQIAEAQKIANGSGSEQDIAEAKIELEVLESLQAALK
jgi:F-type H+-transporting ATPase subunit delta